MKQFTTIEKLDTGILYLLELASSLSVLLLAFGLMASLCGFSFQVQKKRKNTLMSRDKAEILRRVQR